MIHHPIVLFSVLLVLNAFGKPAPRQKKVEFSTEVPTTTTTVAGTTVAMTTKSTKVFDESVIPLSTVCLECAPEVPSKLNRTFSKLNKTDTDRGSGIGDVLCSFCDQYTNPEHRLICRQKNCAFV